MGTSQFFNEIVFLSQQIMVAYESLAFGSSETFPSSLSLNRQVLMQRWGLGDESCKCGQEQTMELVCPLLPEPFTQDDLGVFHKDPKFEFISKLDLKIMESH